MDERVREPKVEVVASLIQHEQRQDGLQPLGGVVMGPDLHRAMLRQRPPSIDG